MMDELTGNLVFHIYGLDLKKLPLECLETAKRRVARRYVDHPPAEIAPVTAAPAPSELTAHKKCTSRAATAFSFIFFLQVLYFCFRRGFR